MAVYDRGNIRRLWTALLTGAAVCAYLASSPVAIGQDGLLASASQDDSKLLLTANELTYNRDSQRVIAKGVVRMKYSGYRMVAQQVEYNQQTGRVIAHGNIELIEPGVDLGLGSRIDHVGEVVDASRGLRQRLRAREGNEKCKMKS